MQLVLIQDVPKVGKKGEAVKVSDGYGRNFLLARGLAVMATDGRLRTIAKESADKAGVDKRAVEAAEALAAKLQAQPLRMEARFGEGGKIFGSITGQDIAKAIKEQWSLEVDKRTIKIDTPFKAVGDYKVSVKLHPKVKATVAVTLVEAK